MVREGETKQADDYPFSNGDRISETFSQKKKWRIIAWVKSKLSDPSATILRHSLFSDNKYHFYSQSLHVIYISVAIYRSYFKSSESGAVLFVQLMNSQFFFRSSYGGGVLSTPVQLKFPVKFKIAQFYLFRHRLSGKTSRRVLFVPSLYIIWALFSDC